MKEIIKKEIKLSKELINKNINNLKAIDLIKFLVTVGGIEYNRKLSLKDISISKLTVDGFKIASA